MNIKEEMKFQVAQLNRWTKLYNEGHPEVSDKVWDDYYFRLVKFEEDFPDEIRSDSPTQHIEYKTVDSLKKKVHDHLMLSLAKTKDWDEFLKYFHDIDNSKDVVGMLKLDGLTATLRYENGKLVSAETRGNGEVGEDILHNILTVAGVPKSISYRDTLVVDGEVICNQETFDKYFADEYKNARNFASGSIRLLNSAECDRRRLDFIVWNVVEGFDNESHIQNLRDAEKLGFTIVPYTSSFDWDAKEFLLDAATQLGYPIDGLVGKFDDIQFGLTLGNTDHHFKYAYAFKLYDEEYETELEDIEWGMSRNGVLTPVAIFKTVEIDDTEVSRASLSNISIMEKILGKPFKGQHIWIRKSNQIIPQVVKAKDENGEWI